MSGSILTNSSAMTALQTLRSISSDMSSVQGHISTGKRISQASDNLAYWGISGTLKSDNMVLSTVKDSLELGLAKVNQAYVANQQIHKEVDAIKQDLANALANSENKGRLGDIQQDIISHLKNIANSVGNADMDGENLLTNSSSGNAEFVASFHRSGNAVEVEKITIDRSKIFYGGVDAKDFSKSDLVREDSTSKQKDKNGKDIDVNVKGSGGLLTKLFGKANKFIAIDKDGIHASDLTKVNSILGKDGKEVGKGAITADDIKKFMDIANEVSVNIKDVDVVLGSAKQQIDSQVEFINRLTDNVTKSVGSLVDADMDAESTRLTALQVQQQLAVQALSIANQSSNHILSLFRS